MIHTIYYDESHNLLMGKFSEDIKEECLELKSRKKFFLTATPCNSISKNGRGMNNVKKFGEIIYHKSYREMIEKGEILPLRLHTIDVSHCLILKNKENGINKDNLKDSDFDRDCTVKSRAIVEVYAYHSAIVKKYSSQPDLIDGKMIATIDSFAELKGILQSEEIIKAIKSGIHVFAISTELKYFHNGVYYTGTDFKEKFLEDLKNLNNNDRAIILHIDMIGEGLDNKGITGCMAFSVMGLRKAIQLWGRTQRLHEVDRKNLYAGKIIQGVPREESHVKPYGYIMLPLFLRDSNDNREEVRKLFFQIHNELDFIPVTICSSSRVIGDSETDTNTGFMATCEKYEVLDFTQEIEEVKKQEMLEKIEMESFNEAMALAKSFGI